MYNILSLGEEVAVICPVRELYKKYIIKHVTESGTQVVLSNGVRYYWREVPLP